MNLVYSMNSVYTDFHLVYQKVAITRKPMYLIRFKFITVVIFTTFPRKIKRWHSWIVVQFSLHRLSCRACSKNHVFDIPHFADLWGRKSRKFWEDPVAFFSNNWHLIVYQFCSCVSVVYFHCNPATFNTCEK